MSSDAKPRFKTNWLTWPVDRRDQTFQVYVVEPREYKPTTHAEIFGAALRLFVFGHETTPVKLATQDVRQRPRRSPRPRRFDLLTFPEAFLSSDTLIQWLDAIRSCGHVLGCIHAGLRPTATNDDETHLFKVTEIETLIDRLKKIPDLHVEDLIGFEQWLDEQDESHRFNLGCLFTIDAESRIRICIHPKLVRSPYERHAIPEHKMAEANLLSLITLKPRDHNLSDLTIQPLICADVLDHPTDYPNNHPLPAITSHGTQLSVDVVSVVTLTPTDKGRQLLSDSYVWKQKFRDSFIRAASVQAYRRHQFATFVLSNFHQFPSVNVPAGLSGIFVPLQLYYNAFASPHVSKTMTIYARFDENSTPEHRWDFERWENATKETVKVAEKIALGYLVTLDPNAFQSDSLATMFRFTLSSIPRDSNRWQRATGVDDIAVLHAYRFSENNESQIVFVDPEQS